MKTRSSITSAVILLWASSLAPLSMGQQKISDNGLPSKAKFQLANDWCVMPVNPIVHQASTRAVTIVNEVEPNDDFANAQVININLNDPNYLINGELPGLINIDSDFYKIWLEQGDILSVRMNAAVQGGGGIKPFVELFDIQQFNIRGNLLSEFTFSYPSISPLFKQDFGSAAIVEYVAMHTANMYVRVTSAVGTIGGSFDDYTLELSLLRAPLGSEPVDTVQRIFLDFDGHKLDAVDQFGFGNLLADLSPLNSFLFNWGVIDEDAVIDAIIAQVASNLDDAIGSNCDFGYELLNSRDHADPGADPYTTRLVVGGTREELGIQTLGIADSIDPGNFDFDEVGVVLLDIFSSTCTQAQVNDPNNPCTQVEHDLSLNFLQYDASFTKIDAIGRVVGNTVSHELGHMLGCWHTDPLSPASSNTLRNLMSSGVANILINMYEIGLDGIMGSSDDGSAAFRNGPYTPNEPIHSPSTGMSAEYTGIRVTTALTKAPGSCDPDVNGDGAVDGADLGLLLNAWGTNDCLFDLNDDGTVDGADLGLLINAWGPCP